MTNPTPLSPAAQAVLDAASDVYWDWTDMEPAASHVIAAAALRAAADQVLPLRLIDEPSFSPGTCCERVLKEERAEMRSDLLAIAAELDGTNPSESD